MGWNYLSILRLQRCSRNFILHFVMDIINTTQGFKLIHVCNISSCNINLDRKKITHCEALWLVQDFNLSVTNLGNTPSKFTQHSPQSWQGRVLVRFTCFHSVVCVLIPDTKYRMIALSWDITWRDSFTHHCSGQITNHSVKWQETTEKYVSHLVSRDIFNSSPASAAFIRQWVRSALATSHSRNQC